MGTHLQKCGDGQCRNAAVTIGDEPLEIHVAGGHYSWVEVGNAREGLDGCIAEGGLGRAQEDLKHRHCRLDLSGSDVLHVDNGPCSLVHHHLQHSAGGGGGEGGGGGGRGQEHSTQWANTSCCKHVCVHESLQALHSVRS